MTEKKPVQPSEEKNSNPPTARTREEQQRDIQKHIARSHQHREGGLVDDKG